MNKLISTDLSASIDSLTIDQVREIILKTQDDKWAIPFVDLICHDIEKFDVGMSYRAYYTVRMFAVHAFNRAAYYNARTRQLDARGHRFMDLLLAYTSPMEGSIPPSIRYKEDPQPYLIYEQFGKFNFHTHIRNVPELQCYWKEYGWTIMSDYDI